MSAPLLNLGLTIFFPRKLVKCKKWNFSSLIIFLPNNESFNQLFLKFYAIDTFFSLLYKSSITRQRGRRSNFCDLFFIKDGDDVEHMRSA